MIDHPFKPHETWKDRDSCEERLHDPNDENIYGICGAPRSAHMDSEHALKIQLATALRERDVARRQAAEWQKTAYATREDRDAKESERDAAQANTQKWLSVVGQLRENLNATLLERDALRAALEAATNALFSARNMLQAINEGDPTPDRKRAADRAWEAEKAARAALAGGGDRG